MFNGSNLKDVKKVFLEIYQLEPRNLTPGQI